MHQNPLTCFADVAQESAPAAPTAYGQPPRPATEVSTVVTPICSAASTLATPWPYVSCMRAASALTGTALAAACTADSHRSIVQQSISCMWCRKPGFSLAAVSGTLLSALNRWGGAWLESVQKDI